MAVTTRFKVSVVDLAEQTVRGGDINFRFQPRSSSAEGIKGHQRLQRSRGENYVAERAVSLEVTAGDVCLQVNGRVDGYVEGSDPLIVEEIKTLRADIAELPPALQAVHWAQAKVYAWVLARETDIGRVRVRLCYLQLDDDTEHHFEEEASIDELGAFFDSLVQRYLARIRKVREWRETRDTSIEAMKFPYADFRPGQREMAVGVYRAICGDEQAIVQAPTGIGKTIATLFPALKALREKQHDKLFYVTARTSGQRMAEITLGELRNRGLALRDVTITAKEKICFNPGSPCEPDQCEYARGYYDRLPNAIDATLAEHGSLTRPVIEERAEAFTVCPFEFSLDLARWADVIVCDYNYVFDPTAYLRRFFEESSGNYALLIDECHNLVDRGRDMFSAEVIKGDFLAVRRAVKAALPVVARRLGKVNREILALRSEAFHRDGYIVDREVPGAVVRAMRGFCDAAEDWLKRNEPSAFQESLLTLYFDGLRFIRTAELFDDNYACLLVSRGKDMVLKLYCVDPAPLLRQGLERVSATVGFSATMGPRTYFQQLLGLGEDAGWYRLASPFASEHLGVFVANHISTAWRDREATLEAVAELVYGVTTLRPGNYLIFFPSYAYLNSTLQAFNSRFPDVDTIAQRSDMSDEERNDFLAAFDDEGEHLLGFAVMGGVFGEGIDLTGTRLIGVVVVGVGLPQIGIERDLIRDYFDESGRGFEFAYQFPGMNRVLQTAGRVIRSESDRGIVCLVDSRFSQPRYRHLYPPEWHVSHVSDHASLTRDIRQFWDGHYAVTSDAANGPVDHCGDSSYDRSPGNDGDDDRSHDRNGRNGHTE